MDGNRIFGGNPLGVFIRLILLSVVVGIVLSALGISPQNLIYHIRLLIQRIYDLGFESIEWAFQYFLLGALVVFPVWLIARLLGLLGGGRRDR